MQLPISRARLLALGALALLGGASRRADAQAWFYPSFQQPQTVEREYNFAAVAASGADFVFQWREGIAPGSQLSLDAGLADPSGPSNTRLLIAGNYARELTRATPDQPLDVLLTAGIGVAPGGGVALLRIPLGVSVGHTFPLDGGLSVTPYVHPRVSIDAWTHEHDNEHSYVSLDFDVGANLAITPEMAVRGSFLFSGNGASSGTGFGVSLAIKPPGLKKH